MIGMNWTEVVEAMAFLSESLGEDPNIHTVTAINHISGSWVLLIQHRGEGGIPTKVMLNDHSDVMRFIRLAKKFAHA